MVRHKAPPRRFGEPEAANAPAAIIRAADTEAQDHHASPCDNGNSSEIKSFTVQSCRPWQLLAFHERALSPCISHGHAELLGTAPASAEDMERMRERHGDSSPDMEAVTVTLVGRHEEDCHIRLEAVVEEGSRGEQRLMPVPSMNAACAFMDLLRSGRLGLSLLLLEEQNRRSDVTSGKHRTRAACWMLRVGRLHSDAAESLEYDCARPLPQVGIPRSAVGTSLMPLARGAEDDARRAWQRDLLQVLAWLAPSLRCEAEGSCEAAGSDREALAPFSVGRLFALIKPSGSEPDLPQGRALGLLPTLRPYQRRAVAWMLRREAATSADVPPLPAASSTSDGRILHPLWQRLELLSPPDAALLTATSAGDAAEPPAALYVNPFTGLLSREVKQTARAPNKEGFLSVYIISYFALFSNTGVLPGAGHAVVSGSRQGRGAQR